jgi:peptidoglycan/LPS O-acetylase OafA/YrhL
MTTANKKDIPLEALRGFAAITVMLWHSMLGFFPQWSGIFPDKWPQGALNGQVWFGLIYGDAAVILFFVLSGFVLTRRTLVTGERQIILRGVIKRWPRLAGPVLITVLISWLLFTLDAYSFKQGGAITGSPWLSRFAYAYAVPFEPFFWDAFCEGTFLTFFQGDIFYDSSLWTMRYEFIGSFLSFGLALLLAQLPLRGTRLLRLAIIAVIWLLCYFASPIYASFPAGVALAAFLPEQRAKLPGWAVGILILTAIYLFGFTGANVGAFVLLASILKLDFIIAQIIASMLIIVAFELAPDTFRRLVSSRFAEVIGALSFPLYLIHVLVLCSLGCATLIWARTWASGAYPNIIAGATTIICSILAAIPLAFFNERWVAFINRATDRLLSHYPLQSLPGASKSAPKECRVSSGRGDERA